MALVITLLIIILATFASVAFFARVTSNRTVEQRRASSIEADQLASSAADYVTSVFLNEIRNTDTTLASGSTQNGVSIYWPLSGTSAVPKRLVTSGVLGADAAFRCLVRQSGTSAGASDHSTSIPSRDGRLITGTSWTAPMLTTGTFTNAQVPNWIYVLANGTFTADPTTATATNPVVGRFAYNVYNEGGLLDVNVAGRLPMTSSTSTELAELKRFSASADLSLIPGITDPTKFTNWRNRVSGTSVSGYLSAVTTATSGFLTPLKVGDNRITSRQDLIKLAKSDSCGINTGALPYLTTFSRALTAPSWRPPSWISELSSYSSSPINLNLPNVRVTKAFTRSDGTPALEGEPLLKGRFPLSRLAPVTYYATDSGTGSIYQYFGLKRTSQTESWTYNHGTPGYIMKLTEVAAAGREPDFFELLKATLFGGSLGQTPGSVCTKLATDTGPAGTGFVGYSSKTDMQILRIGASIIDQYDIDSYPTAIYLGVSGPVTGNTYIDTVMDTAYGVENLPYLYRLVGVFYRMESNNDHLGMWAQPIIWNPHAERLIDATNIPNNFRVTGTGGLSVDYNITVTASTGSTATVTVGPVTRENSSEISFSRAQADSARSNPTQVKNLPQAAGIFLVEFTDSTSGKIDEAKAGVTNPRSFEIKGNTPTVTRDFTFVLEYEDAWGVFRPYDHLARLNFMPEANLSLARFTDPAATQQNAKQGTGDPAGAVSRSITRVDPRTDRFSASVNNCIPSLNTNLTYLTATNTLASEGRAMYVARPRPTSGFSYLDANPGGPGTKFWLGELALNKELTSGTSFAYYKDPDTIVRPADAIKSSGTNGHPGHTGGTTDPRRPIILNRPFRSVAELGYAFRDQPFASINFSPDSDKLSGDLGVLDVFSIAEEPTVVSGQIDPNFAPAQVFAALLKDTTRQDGLATSPAANFLASGTALSIGEKLVTAISSYTNAYGSLSSRGSLAVALAQALNSVDGTENYNKNLREASIRALAPVANTRTWNLMADIVVQTGKFPPGLTTSGTNFLVTGERRRWTHMAIDRYTGKLVDSRMENVNE